LIPHFSLVWLPVKTTVIARTRDIADAGGPKFLAFLSCSNSERYAARSACVQRSWVIKEKKADPDFAKQVEDAHDAAIDLLLLVAHKRAVEGDLEPIVYMGVVTGWVRKYDTKLQIEMLRAYRPDRFKTPGTNVNVGVKSDVFVFTEEERHELMRVNRQWLEEHPVADTSVSPARPALTMPVNGSPNTGD